MTWKRGDPRASGKLSGRRIIIVAQGGQVVGATVNNHHGYHIELDDEILGGKDRAPDFISDSDCWDEAWIWDYAPDPSKILLDSVGCLEQDR